MSDKVSTPFCPLGDYQRPLVLFFGGAGDVATGVVRQLLYPTYIPDGDEFGPQQYTGYAQYDQTELVLGCIRENYDDYKQKICLIGHSWGGDAALQTCRALESQKKQVALLATLDPVSQPGSRIFNSRTKPGNVENWINVYVNYKEAKSGFANNIARIGGPWGFCASATSNYEWPYKGGDAHAYAYDMFKRYVEPEVRKIK